MQNYGRELVSSGVLVVLGLVVIGGATRYSFGTLGNPGPGFFPVVLGSLLLILSGSRCFRSVMWIFAEGKEKKDASFFSDRSSAKRVGTIFASLLFLRFAFPFLGLLPGLFAFSFLVMIALEPTKWRKVLIFSVLSSVGNYLLFSVWLQIEFPVGIFGL
jgi:putative tricarboxylic transport membrane protein